MRRSSLLSAGLLLLVVASSAAHVALLGRRFDYRGVLLPLDHFFALLVASALFLLCTAAGRKALRAAGVTIDDPVEGIPFAAATGAAGIGTVLLLAGVVGLLRHWGLVLIVAAIVALSWSEYSGVRSWLTRLPAALRAHGLSNAALGLQALLLFFPLVLALRPPSDWDSLMYHLDVPADYLASGQVYLPPDNLHAVFLGPIQLLYVPLLALAAPSAPAILNVLFAAALPLAMLATASRFLAPGSGPLAAVSVWGNTTLVLVAATARIDATLCLFTFLGQLALLRASYNSDGRRYYLLAAVLLGAAIGVKLHALVYVLALVPLIVWAAIAQGSGGATSSNELVRRASLALATFAGIGVLASLPWLVRNQLLAGAPFPILASARMPPWIADLFDARAIPFLDPYTYDWVGLMRSPFNLLDAFVAPHRLTIEIEGRLYFFSPFLLLVPLWLAKPRFNGANWLALAGIGYLVILLWPFPYTNLRYLLPATIPLTLVAAHGIVVASERLAGARTIQRVLSLAALAPTILAASIFASGTQVIGHALGVRSESDYLPNTPVGELRALVRQVPRGGRVLWLFEARGYGVDRAVLQDNVGTNWPLLVGGGADVRCLSGTGITHVLVNRGAVEYYVSRGLDASRLHWPAFVSFEKRCLEELSHTSSFTLYSIRR